jgi:hypothetical protein
VISAICVKKSGARQRPLIFVAHSLGRIIVKGALIFSNEATDEELKAVKLSTCGIIFLGTPHQGTNYSSLGHVLQNAVMLSLSGKNDRLLQSLESDSKYLELHLEPFKGISSDFPIVSFFELLPTRFLGIVSASDIEEVLI